MKKKLKNRLFHLNSHDFFIFQHFHLKIELDTFGTILFKVKINVMKNLPRMYLFEHINAYFLGKKQRNIHWLCTKKIF